MSWQITVLPQFKHVNRSSFHIYIKHEININKHQKVFYFNRGTHQFSSVSPPKLICSSVWFVVKAGRDTAAATGYTGNVKHRSSRARLSRSEKGGLDCVLLTSKPPTLNNNAKTVIIVQCDKKLRYIDVCMPSSRSCIPSLNHKSDRRGD